MPPYYVEKKCFKTLESQIAVGRDLQTGQVHRHPVISSALITASTFIKQSLGLCSRDGKFNIDEDIWR